MRELWFWRGAAAVATLGWLVTVWAPWSAPDRAPSARTEAPVEREVGAPEGRQERRRVRFAGADEAPARRTPFAASQVQPGPGQPIPEEVMERAREEVRGEWRARREARAEERLGGMLDGVAEFATAHDLDSDTQGALEDAVINMHQRLDRLRQADGGEEREGPPSEERRQQFRDSFDQMDREVREALGEDLAEAFHEQMRPPDRRGPPPI